jgi:NAD(P) transhydrogenase subunit alpha
MQITILKERNKGESRVAATPDSVKKLIALGATVLVEQGSGEGSRIKDEAFVAAGATIAKDPASACKNANIILKVAAPTDGELALMPKGALLIGLLAPLDAPETIPAYAKAGVNAYAMELIPRISRAQSMDALSSQSNLLGYRAVIDAAAALEAALPMMMTAAGTVPPAKFLVLGAGVAGLQAIATAKRLGAVVSAFDVRPAVKEQVQSLGASFVEVPADPTETAETKGGYAGEMSEAYKLRQRDAIAAAVAASDAVICTALIPGKKAPELVTAEMVRAMKPGSVIVDLAAASGGNCALTVAGKIAIKEQVTIIGDTNLISKVAVNASALYARNLLNLLGLMISKEKTLVLNREDEIIREGLLTFEGAVVHARFLSK